MNPGSDIFMNPGSDIFINPGSDILINPGQSPLPAAQAGLTVSPLKIFGGLTKMTMNRHIPIKIPGKKYVFCWVLPTLSSIF